MQPETIATIETDLFEHRTVQPHFINPCCFGEDFAAWLKTELADPSGTGFSLSEPIQEDYGWGLGVKYHGEDYWIAMSYVGTGPTEQPARWVVSLSRQGGARLLKRLFEKPNCSAPSVLRNRVRSLLESTSGIKIDR